MMDRSPITGRVVDYRVWRRDEQTDGRGQSAYRRRVRLGRAACNYCSKEALAALTRRPIYTSSTVNPRLLLSLSAAPCRDSDIKLPSSSTSSSSSPSSVIFSRQYENRNENENYSTTTGTRSKDLRSHFVSGQTSRLYIRTGIHLLLIS